MRLKFNNWQAEHSTLHSFPLLKCVSTFQEYILDVTSWEIRLQVLWECLQSVTNSLEVKIPSELHGSSVNVEALLRKLILHQQFPNQVLIMLHKALHLWQLQSCKLILGHQNSNTHKPWIVLPEHHQKDKDWTCLLCPEEGHSHPHQGLTSHITKCPTLQMPTRINHCV